MYLRSKKATYWTPERKWNVNQRKNTEIFITEESTRKGRDPTAVKPVAPARQTHKESRNSKNNTPTNVMCEISCHDLHRYSPPRFLCEASLWSWKHTVYFFVFRPQPSPPLAINSRHDIQDYSSATTQERYPHARTKLPSHTAPVVINNQEHPQHLSTPLNYASHGL